MFRQRHLPIKKIVKPENISLRGCGFFLGVGQVCLRPPVAVGGAVLELKGGLTAPACLSPCLAMAVQLFAFQRSCGYITSLIIIALLFSIQRL